MKLKNEFYAKIIGFKLKKQLFYQRTYLIDKFITLKAKTVCDYLIFL